MNHESNNQNRNNQRGMMKHGLVMMVCCLLPILLVGALPLLGIKAAWLSYLAALACPLGMIFMMLSMGHMGGNNNNNASCHQNNRTDSQDAKDNNFQICFKNNLPELEHK